MQFSKRLDRFGDEIFAALNNRRMELEAQGMKIYNMSVGTPDFKTPEYIKKAVAEAAMDDNNWKYSLRDLPELLDAVCIYYKKRFDVELTPDMVMTVYGSQEGMGHLGMALCDEGDTVLLPDPCYPVFAAGSLMAGAVPYYYPLVAEHDFLPYVKGIPEEIANKAKYMVVSLPSNPVGSIATPGLYEEIVEFFSLSKSFNVTGARLSFLVGRPDVIAALRKLRSQIDFGMFLPLQKAAIAALQGPLDSVKEQCQKYQERRDALCQGLRDIGWELPNGKGTMFVWAKIPGGRTDSMAFCMELMEKAGVIVTPGASFGPHGEGYVRFALVLPPEKIREAVEAIRKSGLN